MVTNNPIRCPIVTVVGHVDHGKTSILDCFRGTCNQEEEAGGITQKISFTKLPLSQINITCPLIKKTNIALEIPGFLFIDTPGHAAFTNLRKRGGALADLAILVVNVKEGIKPQTAEALQILKANKVPFVIALNKIDSISGWKQHESLSESISKQSMHTSDEFQEALLTFQGSLKEHGFDSELYHSITDFTKHVAIVPCSAKTKEGISELLMMLCGLSQKFLKERLKLSEEAMGVILEIKKDSTIEWAEAILYDGTLDEGDELVIANLGEPITSKVRAIQEILPLSNKFVSTDHINAASGVRIQLTNKEGILPGMPFQEVKKDIEEVKKIFKKEFSNAIKLDKQGIIIKADSLGSLEALIFLLKQENIQVVKAGIGSITKFDLISAQTNLENNPLDAIILGFNVELETDIAHKNIKILTNQVIYKLIEDLQKWRTEKQKEIEKERLMNLATICKIEILPQFLFRNSNPAIFGVKIIAGKIKPNIPLINEKGEQIAHVKAIQQDKSSVREALEGASVAISLPGVNFERQLNEIKYLYADISESQLKQFKKNKDLLSSGELKVLQEICQIKKY